MAKVIFEPMVDRGLVGDLPRDARHSFCKRGLNVGIPLRCKAAGIKVRDVDIRKFGGLDLVVKSVPYKIADRTSTNAP